MTDLSSFITLLQDPQKLAKKLEEFEATEKRLKEMYRGLNDEKEAFKKERAAAEGVIKTGRERLEKESAEVKTLAEEVARDSQSLSTRRSEFDKQQAEEGERLAGRAEALNTKEKELDARITEQTASARTRANEINLREKALGEREVKVKEREDVVTDREKTLERRIARIQEAING